MGFLEFSGDPMDWNEIKPHVKYVKEHGIIQFLNNYQRHLQRPKDILKWGDEVSVIFTKIIYCQNEIISQSI